MSNPTINIPADALMAACREALINAGAHAVIADDIAHALVTTSLRGIDSHGVVLLARILKRVEAGRCQITQPTAAVDGCSSPAVAVFDAHLGAGQHAAMAAARHAVAMAENTGIGMVSIRNSTHFGACSPYLLEVMKHGFVGIVGSNSTPSMAAFGAQFANLGNNPFGFGCPVEGAPDVLFDFSSGVMSFGQLNKLRAAGLPVPEDAFIKPKAPSKTDHIYEVAGALEYVSLPFGGFKGSSVAMMIEVLSGVLSGGNFGARTEVMSDGEFLGPSHFVLALNPQMFGLDDIEARMATYCEDIRQGQDDIRLPGENAEAIDATRRAEGIPMEASLWETFGCIV